MPPIRYARTSPISASMIHEARMIIMHVFSRPETREFFTAGRKKTPKSTGLTCAFCITVRKKNPEPAITIMNGQACCSDHTYYAQGGQYNVIMEKIQRDEVKR